MTEKPAPTPNQTDLLFGEIIDLFGESEDLAQKEIATLKHLRNRVVAMEAYYIMMLRFEGQKSTKARLAQGVMLKRVREFVAHLESLGLDASKFTTASAIAALPFPRL